jgi:predicted enzyme related to lactoylglutathione lyase
MQERELKPRLKPRIKKVAFTVYPSTDLEASKAFYEGLLGLAPGAGGSHGGKFWMEYDLPEGGCLALSNATVSKPSAEAGGTIAFEVDDLDGLVAMLKANNVTIMADVIHGPNCRMVPVLDPDGNGIILHQLNAPRV